MKVVIEFDVESTEFKNNYHSALKNIMSKIEFALKYNKKEKFIAVMREKPEEMRAVLTDKFGHTIGSVIIEK